MSEQQQETKPSRFGFVLVIVNLVFEYARMQDFVPAIGALRPTMLLVPLNVIAWSRSRNFRRVTSPQLTLLLVLLALLIVHIPFAMNHAWALQQTQDYLLLLPFCVSAILFVDTPERVLTLIKWWVLLALYVSLRAIAGGGVAGSSFLGDQNDVSLLLDTMLPFVLCLAVYERRVLMRLGYVVIVLACLAGIVITASRGGFVGLVAVVAVIWLISPRKVLALVVVCVLFAGTYQFAPKSYWDRIATIQTSDLDSSVSGYDRNAGTAKGRLSSWQAAWDMFKDHPLGVGPGNFPIRFPEYQGTAFGRHGMWGRAAHSLWFTLLAELGIPGVILYALLMKANWRSLWRLLHVPAADPQHQFAYLLSVAFLAGLAGFFASGTFVSVLFYPHYWYLTAMIVAAEKTLAPAVSGPGQPVVPGSAPHGTVMPQHANE